MMHESIANVLNELSVSINHRAKGHREAALGYLEGGANRHAYSGAAIALQAVAAALDEIVEWLTTAEGRE